MKPKKKIYLLVLILLIQLLLPTITHAQVSTTNTFTGIIQQNQNLIAGTYQVSTNQSLAETLQDGFVDQGWHDTVLVLPGQSVKILLTFQDFTRSYLYHYHNLELEDMGMMRTYLI
jgi:formaldehyde-activating enzyme involved in methanogenesis